MSTDRPWKATLCLAILLAVLLPPRGEAGPMDDALQLVDKHCLSVRGRPVSDFLNAQGTLNEPPQFFPPVRDYVGWADGGFITFGLVDYAGLANEYIKAQTGHSLGTRTTGLVLECKLADDRSQIVVALLTTRALGFAQSIADLEASGFDFLNTPTIFGAKAQDVVAGAEAAVGPAVLLTTFSIARSRTPVGPCRISWTSSMNRPATHRSR
jgi:hypothetical protein